MNSILYEYSSSRECSGRGEGFDGTTLVFTEAPPSLRAHLPLATHSPPSNTYNYIYYAHAEIIYISAEFVTILGN